MPVRVALYFEMDDEFKKEPPWLEKFFEGFPPGAEMITNFDQEVNAENLGSKRAYVSDKRFTVVL